MTDGGAQESRDEGGMGCWWMIVIAIIVIFAILVGYLVLV